MVSTVFLAMKLSFKIAHQWRDQGEDPGGPDPSLKSERFYLQIINVDQGRVVESRVMLTQG